MFPDSKSNTGTKSNLSKYFPTNDKQTIYPINQTEAKTLYPGETPAAGPTDMIIV